jgi:hypothetical protein
MPAKQLADAEASIRAAKELGAEDEPAAALQLKIARDGLQEAQRLTKEGEHDRARPVLEEAELDAELAILLTRQEESEAKALRATQRVAELDSPNQPGLNERSNP